MRAERAIYCVAVACDAPPTPSGQNLAYRGPRFARLAQVPIRLASLRSLRAGSRLGEVLRCAQNFGARLKRRASASTPLGMTIKLPNLTYATTGALAIPAVPKTRR